MKLYLNLISYTKNKNKNKTTLEVLKEISILVHIPALPV